MPEPESDLAHFRTHGMQWIALKPYETALREIVVPALDSPDAAGAVLLKRSLSRSVFRFDAGGTAVFVKHHTVRSLKERLKYMVVPSRASAEWAASLAMRDLGLPAARAVAFGERRVGGVLCEAVLVTEAIEGAVPLDDALADAGARAGLLADAAKLIRAAHDRHVHHRDLHGGNLLVAGGKVFFIDLHRATLGRALAPPVRARSVGHFLAFTAGGVDADDRAAFVRQYLGPDAPQAEVDEFAARVDEAVAAFRERRYASRTKRCVKRSTGFRIARRDGMKVYRRADVAPELVAQVIAQHETNASAGAPETVIKRDRRACVTVVELDADGGAGRFCVKEFIRPGLLRRLGDWLLGSKARRAWVGSNACRVRGISTPAAIAAVEAGARSFFITEYVEGSRQLNDAVADTGRPSGAEAVRRWRRFVLAAADFVRRLHSHRLRHTDLSAKNLLVRERDGGWDFMLVDTGDIWLGRGPTLSEKIANLGQLDQIYVMPSRADRLRFYRHYSRGRPELDNREFLAEINAISRARHENWLVNGGGAAILEERRQQGKAV